MLESHDLHRRTQVETSVLLPHLAVYSAKDVDGSLLSPGSHVAATVHARVDALSKRIAHKCSCCQLVPVQVSSGQAGPADHQLSRYPCRTRCIQKLWHYWSTNTKGLFTPEAMRSTGVLGYSCPQVALRIPLHMLKEQQHKIGLQIIQ